MFALIPDGVYKILNVRYPGCVADLVWGNPLGVVCGYVNNADSANQEWKVKNIGNDNHVTLESICAPRSYASAYIQLRGALLSGSERPTIWAVRNVGEGRFHLMTADGRFVWFLPHCDNYLAILLHPASENEGPNAQWMFQLVDT